MDCIGTRFKICFNKAVFDGNNCWAITNLDTNEHYPQCNYLRNWPANFKTSDGVLFAVFDSSGIKIKNITVQIDGISYGPETLAKTYSGNGYSISMYSDATYSSKPEAWTQTSNYIILEVKAGKLRIYYGDTEIATQDDVQDTISIRLGTTEIATLSPNEQKTCVTANKKVNDDISIGDKILKTRGKYMYFNIICRIGV